MIILIWIIFTYLTMADIGKYHFLPSDLTILLYGMVSLIMGYVRARLRLS